MSFSPDFPLLGTTATFETLFTTNNDMIARLNLLDIATIKGGTGILASSIDATGGITLSVMINGGTGINISSTIAGGITLSVDIKGGTGISIESGVGGTTLSTNIKGGTGISIESGAGGTTLSAIIKGGTGISIESGVGGITVSTIINGGTGINIESGVGGITISTSSSNYVLSSSRTIAQIVGTGFSAGNVISYHSLAPIGFTKANASTRALAEVFGIIESITGGIATIVTNGSINLSGLSGTILFNSGDGGSGGNDVYFLSAATAGVMQNIGPTGSGQIIKPIYYASDHTSSTGVTFTGIVVSLSGFLNA